MIFLSAAALQDDDSFDFHKPVEGQFLDGHAGTGGAVRIENSRVGFVDFLEVGHAGQEHGSFDDVLFRGSHFSQQRLDILQGLAGLGAYAAFSQFAGCGIDAQLAGKVDGVSGTVALGVGTDGRGRLAGVDDVFPGFLVLNLTFVCRMSTFKKYTKK